MSQLPHGSQNTGSLREGERKPPPSQAQTQVELAEIRELKAKLAKARADAAAAVALAAEREPPGGSVDRLRSRVYYQTALYGREKLTHDM